MRKSILIPAVGIPSLAIAATLGVTAASANTTNACTVTNPACFEPVDAVSVAGTPAITSTDAALSVYNGNQLYTRINNNLRDGTQDFVYDVIGHVPHPGHGPGQYKFTGFDRANYGGDPIIVVEWTPRGADSGECLDLTRNGNLGDLENCSNSPGEAFILTSNVPAINPAPSGFSFVVSVRQNPNSLARHNLVTGSPDAFGRVTGTRAIDNDPGVLDDQMWGALP